MFPISFTSFETVGEVTLEVSRSVSMLVPFRLSKLSSFLPAGIGAFLGLAGLVVPRFGSLDVKISGGLG